MTTFQEKVKALRAHHEELLSRKNEPVEWGNGIYEKYKNPILTAEHTPLEWRYDFDEKSNPYLMQRIMMNATLNSGAIKWNGKYLLVVRVEGADRKSFFAVAESPNGIDNFRFWDEPITMPEDVIPATNIYDMRLTFNGMSGESMTPCNRVRNSGTMPSTWSVTNTWLQYS